MTTSFRDCLLTALCLDSRCVARTVSRPEAISAEEVCVFFVEAVDVFLRVVSPELRVGKLYECSDVLADAVDALGVTQPAVLVVDYAQQEFRRLHA